MVLFPEKAAVDYDDRIHRMVPGYALLHQLAPALIASLLPAEATLLVAGAGTGLELAALAAAQPGWRFLAVDPSEAMLAGARRRAAELGVSDRIAFHVAGAEDFTAKTPCDGALSLLVAQFVPDRDGARGRYFAGLARNLKPGAPLLLADIALPRSELDPAYRLWAQNAGMPPERVDWLFGKLAENFHPVTDARLGALLADAGFAPPTRFFQAFAFHGHYTFKL